MAQSWGFLTNHALVMVYVVCHPDSTVREISDGVGITERATLAILRELDDEGIVDRHRDGRRNTYTMNFPALASYRREGAVTRTPPEFVDMLVRTLAKLREGSAQGTARTLPDTRQVTTRHGTWGFFTNHLLTLLEIANGHSSTVREMAMRARMTERAVVSILKQLHDERIISKNREGRRNSYDIDFEAFRAFERWSTGTWRLPDELIEVAVKGLKQLSERSRGASGSSIEREQHTTSAMAASRR